MDVMRAAGTLRGVALVILVLLSSLVAAQTVNGYTVTVSPSTIPMGRSSLVTIDLRDAYNAPAQGREVALCGASLNAGFPSSPPATLGSYRSACPAVGTSGTDGRVAMVVSPSTTSPIYVYLDGTYAQRSVTVSAGALAVLVSPDPADSDDGITLTVLLPDNSAPSGSLVRVSSGTSILVYDQPTDINGRVYVGRLAAGSYAVRASRSGFDDWAGTLTVRQAAAPLIQVISTDVPSTAVVGREVVVSMRLANQGNAAGAANVQLLVDGALRETRSVSLAVNATEALAFSFTPTAARAYSIELRVADVYSALWTLTAEPPPPPFQLRDLLLPASATAGSSYTVQATVVNPTSSGAWATVRLAVAGTALASREVWVPAGSTAAATFSATAGAEGEQRVTVSVGDASLTGAFPVTAASARFALSRFDVPSDTLVGASFQASVTLTNEGSARGSTDVTLLVDGVARRSVSRTLSPGGSTRITYEPFTPTAPGTLRVEVLAEGVATEPRTVNVLAAPTPPSPRPPTPSPSPRVELRDRDGAPAANSAVMLLGAGADGALLPRGMASADARGVLTVDRSRGATHLALAVEDGVVILPLPASGSVLLPPEASSAARELPTAAREALAARFQDARLFDAPPRQRVAVGYAGVESVEVDTSASGARLVVGRYAQKPYDAIPAPPGAVHAWFGLDLVRADGSAAPLTRATVRFERPAGAQGDLVLLHYDARAGAWGTFEAEEQADGTYAATVESFSLFAIGVRAPATAVATWLLPALAGLVLVGLLVAGVVVGPRLLRKRAPPAPAEPAPPPEPQQAPVVVPVEEARVMPPRVPLGGDVLYARVGVRTGGKTFLEDVSFRVPRGTLVTIVGPAGAGKAMALLAVLGEAPYIGEIDVGGLRPGEDAQTLRRVVGACASGAGLDRERTVEQVFDLVADRRRLPLVDARMRGARLLALFGAACDGATRVGDLAPLDERRVLIAAALLHGPSLLLMDEPTLGLAPEARRALWRDVRRAMEELDLTVLATTQDPEDGLLADGVVLLDEGRVVAVGPPASLTGDLARVAARRHVE